MDYELDLYDICRVLWKNRLWIIGIFLIAVAIGCIMSFTLPSVYRATCIVSLGNVSSIYTDENLVEDLLLGDESLVEVINQLNLDIPPKELRDFKKSITTRYIADRVLEVSIETTDQENATKIVTKLVSLFINKSDVDDYNRTSLSERMNSTKMALDVLDADINHTREILRNIDGFTGVTQEQLELSHSRILEYLRAEESMRLQLADKYFDLKKQLKLLKNPEILMISDEPTEPVKPMKPLIIAIAGMLGLIVGIFVVLMREKHKKAS
jgi:uncharacterized protein involved in exopolysaccharide biosynthesis